MTYINVTAVPCIRCRQFPRVDVVGSFPESYRVQCYGCQMRPRLHKTEHDAIEDWNASQTRPPAQRRTASSQQRIIDGELAERTAALRYVVKDGRRNLQQLYVTGEGVEHWQDVPCENPEAIKHHLTEEYTDRGTVFGSREHLGGDDLDASDVWFDIGSGLQTLDDCPHAYTLTCTKENGFEIWARRGRDGRPGICLAGHHADGSSKIVIGTATVFNSMDDDDDGR